EQFQAMLEDARRGRFDVLLTWSMDRFSREGEWSVSRVMASLQDWRVQFYSYNAPFLDTTGPFAGFLIPLFAWLARQESIRKGKAVKLGMEKAKAQGKAVGRPAVVDKVDAELVVRLRSQGRSWREIAEAHPPVRSASGRKVRPSVGSIRRAYEAAQQPAMRGVPSNLASATEGRSKENQEPRGNTRPNCGVPQEVTHGDRAERYEGGAVPALWEGQEVQAL
ncbi:MAG: recombinase family protein, partial [Chloroflexi bacterium]|nr:recombinase family protein [Chloroflexota bacterium]